VNPRNRVFALIGALFLVSLVYFLVSTRLSRDLVLLGTVDANQVIVSATITGRITRLAVTEGQDVKTGDLVALLEQDELSAARDASDAQARSLRSQLGAVKATWASTLGDTTHTAANARATQAAAMASLQEARANRLNQEAITRRTVAMADQGVSSEQDRDTAVQALQAALAHERAAAEQAAAALAALKAAESRTHQAEAAQETVTSTLDQWSSARAQAAQAKARLDYTRIVAPISGKVGIWAARQGEVASPGTAIVTIIDLDQTWVYAALPETQGDAVSLGDLLKVRMPSGAEVEGRVIVKLAEGDFATQRDVDRRKRDIKTIQIKLLIPNPGMRFVPGMTAEVIVPHRRLVRP
jgi:multidrug resistance efflux pump